MLDCIVVSKIESWHRNDLAFDSFKVLADTDPHIFQGAEIFVSPQLLHKFQDLFLFFVCRSDSVFGDLFSSELVEVLGDSSHEAEFWNEEYLEVLVLPATFYFEQGLLFVCYTEVVLLLVVVFQTG